MDKLNMETRLVFTISLLISVVIPVSEANVTCTVSESSFLCQNIASNTDFPRVLPANIRKVTLIGTDELDGSFPDGLFKNPTWANVSELFILEFNEADHIEKGFLNGLEELQFMSISSCPDLESIDPDVFHSTPDLKALHLDENHSLTIAVVAAALNGKLSKLKYLSLIKIQTNHQHVVLGKNFAEALHRKNLSYLDISGVNMIYVEHAIVQEILENVKYFNSSYSTIVWTPGTRFQVSSFMNNTELLDLTGGQYILHYNITGDRLFKLVLPPNATYIFLQGTIYPLNQVRINVRYTFENCDFKGPKMLDLSRNNITILNITTSGECGVHGLETLNLASNNMEYISPSFLGIFPSLKILDLSTNQLHKMQTIDYFADIFSKNKDLEVIFLRTNYLSFVPSNLFSSNTNLRILDLSENELTYFNIEFNNTWNLKIIDLRKNRLKRLPAATLGQLKQIFLHVEKTADKDKTSMTNILLRQFKDRNLLSEMYKYGYNASKNEKLIAIPAIIPQYIMLNLLENPILCDCDTLDFLKWILFTDISIVNRTTLVCKYGNNEKLLNNAVFEMVRENCRLANTIVTAIALSVPVILGLFTFAIVIHLRSRRARQKENLDNLKREILQDNTNFNFVVFLSYCSQDSDIVEQNIVPSLNKYLKKQLNTRKDLVCTGTDSFVPGMSIINEIHRCISASLVVVPVITPKFLQSHWSQEECIAAIDRHRQVVILMEQHTDTSRAITTIQSLIEQYTRASWSHNEGHFVIRPSWSTICEGIIQIAAETFENHRRQNIGISIESIPLVK